MRLQELILTSICTSFGLTLAFVPERTINKAGAAYATSLFSSVPSDVSSAPSLTLNDIKADLVRACTKSEKPSVDEIKMLVRDLEDKAEQVGEGQSSSITGLMAGEWCVLSTFYLLWNCIVEHVKAWQILDVLASCC